MIDWESAEQLRGPGPRAGGRQFAGRLPGELGIWIFAIGDLLVFALFFVVFVHERGKDPALFDEGRQTLNLTIGTVNTLVLLTGSILVVLGIEAARHHSPRLAARLFGGTILCGLAFIAGKVVDYAHQADLGHSPTTNDFYMFFFVLTWVHLVHLTAGILCARVMWRTARRGAIGARELRTLEAAGVFWHLVDLLWLVLFALLYLVR